MNIPEAFQAALAHHRADRLAEAEALYRQILAAHPGHADSLHLLGVIATVRGRGEEAVALISRAISLRPVVPYYHANLGVALRRIGRLDEAAASLRCAISLQPRYADAHMNFGEVLLELGHVDESIECSRRALELRPDFPEALNNLGNALSQKRQHAGALECHQRAVALKPGSVTFQNNLCTSLIENDRWDEAVAIFQRALAQAPGFTEARANLASACASLGRTDEALALYREALAAQPQLAGTHWNLALLLLKLGQFEEGWREYEWRWRHAGFTGRRRNFPVPQWSGAPANGAKILVHAEQGIGDTIQFLRYVPLVRERARAGRVVLECPASLARLVAQGRCDGFDVVARHDWSGAALPPFDLHVPLLSLPLALGEFEPLRMDAPYLGASEELRAAWREKLGDRPGLRVGLAWAGNPAHNADRHRSFSFETLRPLLHVPGVSFHSLQVEPRAPADARVADFTAAISDFADTAALMSEFDLVVTVDTATAHLAGALGRPVWTLLPFVSDWRWGVARDDTPWYPTMRLFRQRRAGDWDEVVQRAAKELSAVR